MIYTFRGHIPHDLKRSTKLTNKDIAMIREMRARGLSYWQIGRRFNVKASTIYYHCLTDEERKALNKKRNSRPSYRTKEDLRISQYECYHYKKGLREAGLLEEQVGAKIKEKRNM